MAINTEIQDVVQQNRARQNKARVLNVRAGENVFPVLSQQEMRAWANSRLGGARSIAEMKKPWELLLPALDARIVRKVETENPETMEIPGLGSLAVKYQENQAPRIEIRENWQQIPDAGTFLPGGRKVAFYILAGGYGFGPSENVAYLKTQVADHMAQQAFYGFKKPMLEVPDLSAEGAEVPAIREESYGTHATTGEKLIAYGTLVAIWSGYEWNWYQSKPEAERLNAEARKKMEGDRATRQRQRQITSGEAIINFQAFNCRTDKISNGDGWVVRPDGTVRPPDENEMAHSYWSFVEPGELALRWSSDHMSDIDGRSSFEVVKLPIGGCTPAQLEAVRRIETEDIGASAGAFGLEPEVAKKREKLLSDLACAVPKCPATGQKIAWNHESLKKALGSNGLLVAEGAAVLNLLDLRGEFNESCDTNKAQVVRTYRIGEEGVLEALAYDKRGRWNLALRYKAKKEGEKPVEKAVHTGNISGLDGLFGGNVKVVPTKRK